MKNLKFTGEGTFDMVVGARVIPIKAGVVASDLPDEVAAELLDRREGGKPVWEAVTKAQAPANPSK